MARENKARISKQLVWRPEGSFWKLDYLGSLGLGVIQDTYEIDLF